MKIGIDISQTAYADSGVGRSMTKLVNTLISQDNSNEYVLFFSSMRRNLPDVFHENRSNVKIKKIKFPPKLLNFLWNKLHILPIELFIGEVDIFISSDWIEPPTKKAKKVTFIHDLVIYKFPDETSHEIVSTQKRKLFWAIRECQAFICPSSSTKKDLTEMLGVPGKKIHVINWGV